MIKFAGDLYLGQEAAGQKRKIIRKLRSGKYPLGIYVICPAASSGDLLDLIPAFMLHKYAERNIKRRRAADRFRHFRENRKTASPLLVIGIASSKKEAIELCGTILADVYAKTGGYDVRKFLSEGKEAAST